MPYADIATCHAAAADVSRCDAITRAVTRYMILRCCRLRHAIVDFDYANEALFYHCEINRTNVTADAIATLRRVFRRAPRRIAMPRFAAARHYDAAIYTPRALCYADAPFRYCQRLAAATFPAALRQIVAAYIIDFRLRDTPPPRRRGIAAAAARLRH